MMTHHHASLLSSLLVMTACAMLLPWASGSAAPPGAWRATAVQGEATVQEGEAAPVPLAEGRSLEPGERLATGEGGHVVLARGATTITVGPNGRMEFPPGGDDGARTRIVQAMGSLLFKVEKRESQHFEVDTPYLAAVVKGTTFTVSVEAETSTVHVVEGAVEVKALATGQIGLVRPGHTAVVSERKGGRGLTIIGGKPGSSGTVGQGSQADELEDEAGEADQAAGATAPGQVKRLNAMLGDTSVDVAVASKGFVRNAGLATGQANGAGVTEASLGNGNGLGKGLSKAKSGAGNSSASASAAGASGAGNPGKGNAVGLAKKAGAVVSASTAKTDKAAAKALAALAKAKEKALKEKLKVGGGGDDDDDDEDDDD